MKYKLLLLVLMTGTLVACGPADVPQSNPARK